MVETLPPAFYLQDTRDVARALLGKLVVRRLPSGQKLSGVIIETEAYGRDDPASHSFRGPTPRNKSMFGPPGRAYVYFTYGMHYMLNVATQENGVGEAVLIRALEPVAGIDAMRALRGGISDVKHLTNGPGKLAQALGLTRAGDDGMDMTDPRSPLLITPHEIYPFAMTETTRIGITQAANWPWRYYVQGSRFVSRR